MSPSRYAWMQTVKTSISAFGLLSVYWALEIWRFAIWLSLALSASDPRMAIIPAICLCVLILVSFLWFALVLIVYRCLLSLLWSQPPTWLRIGSKGSAFRAWLVMVLATLPSATIAFGGVPLIELNVRRSLMQFFLATKPTDNLTVFAILWVICAAYLFHWFSPKRRQTPTV